MEAWKHESDFKQRVSADPAVRKVLKGGELEDVFRLERYLGHVDAIFARVFGTGQAKLKVKGRRRGEV
jgi:adenylosuccinate lyase